MDLLAIDRDFKLKFDGQLHQIDANILISSLIHTTSIIHEINSSINSGKKIEIKVKALEKGSFLVHVELIENSLDVIKTLFTRDNAQLAAEIITIFIGLLEIKKFLKAKKYKKKTVKNDKTEITNDEGNVLIIENIILNIYEKNNVIQNALSKNFETLNNDQSIEKFEITDSKENSLITIERNEFNDLALNWEEIHEESRNIIKTAILNIIRLGFEQNTKWDFYYRGNKISAMINDTSFYDNINKGEKFAKGDMLKVDLNIYQYWDESVNTWVNKSYQINKVIEHIPRNEQLSFNFEE